MITFFAFKNKIMGTVRLMNAQRANILWQTIIFNDLRNKFGNKMKYFVSFSSYLPTETDAKFIKILEISFPLFESKIFSKPIEFDKQIRQILSFLSLTLATNCIENVKKKV